jgi:outer membrane receptor for ferrienterochelin and colicins
MVIHSHELNFTMKRCILILYVLSVFLLASSRAFSAGVSGLVFEKTSDGKKSPLVGVNVYWAGTTSGTFTDMDGKFQLSRAGVHDYKLVFSLLGYARDTLDVGRDNTRIELEMKPANTNLNEVEIKGKTDNSYVSKLNARATTVVTTGELQRAACCNLAESFETNASIDVSYSDAVSGARQIQLLGLSGIYSQIMTENVPMIRGMAVTYGLNYIPGPWMESIQISKGASSVTNGYEALTGQINVEYKKPATSEKLYVNAFMNSNLRLEGNANANLKINDKLSTMLFVHADNMSLKFDRNDDGFMDLPKLTTYNIFNRWDYINPGKYVSRFGIKYLDETRNGGQMDFDKSTFTFDTTGISEGTKTYGIGIKTQRLEAFWKNGLIFGKSSVGLILYGVNHVQSSFYGINNYGGHEQAFYANLVFATAFGDGSSKLSAGANYLLDAYTENYLENQLTYLYQVYGGSSQDTLFTLYSDTLVNYIQDRTLSVPGVYAEYTYDYKEKFTLILGARADYFDQYGWEWAPRVNMRYRFGENTTLRASAGKAYRVANIFPENPQIFVSQRKLYIANNLDPEVGWNYGLTFTQDFTLFKNKAQFSLDLFRTDFVNQVTVDVDSVPTAVFFYNMDGRSFANSVQAQLTFEPVKRFTVLLAFRVNDVKATTAGRLQQKPMVSLYKGLATLNYATKHEKWKFDLTCQVNGQQRLPDTHKMPPSLQRGDYSPVFVNLLAQATRKFKYVDIYLGGENLTNFRQPDPIVEYWKPYHTHFDGSMVWGPVTGITVYAGVRLAIK